MGAAMVACGPGWLVAIHENRRQLESRFRRFPRKKQRGLARHARLIKRNGHDTENMRKWLNHSRKGGLV